MTVDGRSVVPYDEYGKPVIPTDKEGNALIFLAADGVTYISKDDYIKWQAYWEEQTKLYNQQQVQSYQAPTSVSIKNFKFDPDFQDFRSGVKF